MQQEEQTLLKLALIGALIGLGKVLVSDEKLNFKVVIGRVILGAGVSMIAGAALVEFPELSTTALIGIASALGILGNTAIESILRRIGMISKNREDHHE